MSTLTLAEARAMIETDLNDTALQLMIDDAESEITQRVGALASQVDDFVDELTNILVLSRKASSISTVVEKTGCGNYTSTTLAANDYWLRTQTRILERLASGTNPRGSWGERVTVTYVPQDDTSRRKMVAIDLLKLAINFTGNKSESIGDYSATALEYDEQRDKLIDRLRGSII